MVAYLIRKSRNRVHLVDAKALQCYTLKPILTPPKWGVSQFLAALFGGFAATPAVAASPPTLFFGMYYCE